MSQLSTKEIPAHHCVSPSAGTSDSWCFANVLDKLDHGVLVMDTEIGSIVFCNAMAEEVLRTLGLSPDYESLQAYLITKKILTDPLSVVKNRSHSVMHNNRIIEFTLHTLPGHCISLQAKDITEKKRLESIAQTVNTMDNLGFIFSGIRHEIGNPLNSIKMTNSVLQKNLERFSREDISRYIDRSASEILRMEYLLQSLKNFSMFEKIDCNAHGLNDFLSTLLGLIKPDLDKKKIVLECDLPKDNVKVNIDPRALHQAVLNILTNAADAVTGRPDATITISTTVNGRLAWISISDNGCGMSEDEVRMLFQPFYTNKPHGNGLGLVITQKLLIMMQATLDIDSRIDAGTTVRIGLPLDRKGHDHADSASTATADDLENE